jgi:hypothetical protein
MAGSRTSLEPGIQAVRRDLGYAHIPPRHPGPPGPAFGRPDGRLRAAESRDRLDADPTLCEVKA